MNAIPVHVENAIAGQIEKIGNDFEAPKIHQLGLPISVGYDGVMMTVEGAIEAAKRPAASRGEKLDDLFTQEPAISGGWVFEFDVADDPPDWSWWILVTPTGEGQKMVVAPRAESRR